VRLWGQLCRHRARSYWKPHHEYGPRVVHAAHADCSAVLLVDGSRRPAVRRAVARDGEDKPLGFGRSGARFGGGASVAR